MFFALTFLLPFDVIITPVFRDATAAATCRNSSGTCARLISRCVGVGQATLIMLKQGNNKLFITKEEGKNLLCMKKNLPSKSAPVSAPTLLPMRNRLPSVADVPEDGLVARLSVARVLTRKDYSVSIFFAHKL